MFGDEDADQIVPAIDNAIAEGLSVTGPHPADTVFYQAVHNDQHDAIICMYHDQGHAPMKLIGFENSVIANIHISWLDPNKVRKMTVVGSKRMIVYDDVAEYKIQIFDKGIDKLNIDESLDSYDDFGKFQLIQRAGDLLIPKIDFVEPLETEAKHFIACIRANKRPISDGRNGLMVTMILEAAMTSISNNGERIEINQ